MSKELLKQLKEGDKVWVELEVVQEIDKEGDIQVGYFCNGGEGDVYLNEYNNFSLSNPNELSVRELCEWLKGKEYSRGNNCIELWDDCRGSYKDGAIHFHSLDQLTELVREPNAQRKEEIKKQIEELKQELKEL